MTDPSLTRPPVIYAPCADYNLPAGGIKQLYRHVDILNRNGIEAYVLHKHHGFRVTAFPNSTSVAWCRRLIEELDPGEQGTERRPVRRFVREMVRPDIELRKEDILLIPETYGPTIASAAPGNRKVIFNQNAHYTFSGQPIGNEPLVTPYLSPDVLGTLVVSPHGMDYLRFAFPGHALYRVHHGIDPSRFAYQVAKKRQIAVMPRKLRGDVEQVVSMLKLRDSLRGFEFVVIDNMGEEEVAAVLRESMIFLSFSHREGFGLPPAEAMACGCVVIGYPAFGGTEFFVEDFCYPVPEGDILAFVGRVEEALRDWAERPEAFAAKGRAASDFIGRTYTMAREEEDVLAMWRELDARHDLKLPAFRTKD